MSPLTSSRALFSLTCILNIDDDDVCVRARVSACACEVLYNTGFVAFQRIATLIHSTCGITF